MSNKDSENQDFFAQFLDDYYAESDEHLILARRSLLLLERSVGESANRPLLDELFRSFHTLKGISGMVGLVEAEQLSHHLENYLRAVRQDEVALDHSGVEALIAGTTLLEKIIAAHRNQSQAPGIEQLVERLEALSPESDTSLNENGVTVSEVNIEQPGGESTAEARTWEFVFSPSAALAEQGINVNRVRGHLQEIGEIISSTPLVKNEGDISFQFLVKTSSPEREFASWGLTNLSYSPVDESTELVPTQPLSPESTPASGASMLASASMIRVDMARLDDLMRMIGDLVISRARLQDELVVARRSMATGEWRNLQETSLAMERQLRDLREGVIRVRMVQVGEIFERMKFVVRDLARESEKEIKLELIGQETEIDKFLVERMMDPLLHLVRNAVSHGLESPAERHAQGKPSEGKLTLMAATVGEAVVIEIVDDGRGVDIEQVSGRARAKQLISQGAVVDQTMLLDLLCTPGFSTRDVADRESGRGVGMDVVGRAVAELGGKLSLETEPRRGTRFRVELPLTLAIADALIATAGGQKFAVPQSAVREVIEVERSSVRILENNEIISYRDGVLPLVRLARLFDLAEIDDRPFHVFVIGSGHNALGIAVDRIMGQREIVVRGIADPLVQVAGIAGATDLGDQQVVLILDVGALQQLACIA